MIFALGFALFLFALVCLVADGAYLFRWSARAQAAAQLAAQSGADSVNPQYLYGAPAACANAAHASCTPTIVDISARDRTGRLFAFQRACIQSGDQSAAVPRHPPGDLAPKTPDDPQTPDGTDCRSDGCRVWAAVTRMVDLPIAFPGFPARMAVRGEAFAAPVVGGTQPESACSGLRWVPEPP